jgi:rhodanese-related sulfurtransferase
MPDDLRISVEELRTRMNGGLHFTILDTRSPQVWASSNEKVPGALRVPVDSLENNANLSKIPKDRPIVTYCTSPNEASSTMLAQELKQRGYEHVWALKGGMEAWRSAGLHFEHKAQAA